MDLTALTQILVTREDADAMCSVIDRLRENLMRDRGSFTAQEEDTVPAAWLEALEAALKDNKIKTGEAIEAGEFLVKLKESIENLPVVNLTVAVELKKSGYAAIANRLREYTGETVLLDVQKDAELVAGATIGYKGLFKDYSLKRSLQEFI